jgi:hypothetical protein
MAEFTHLPLRSLRYTYLHSWRWKLHPKDEGFEILTAEVTRSSVVKDVMPRIPPKVYYVSKECMSLIFRAEVAGSKQRSCKYCCVCIGFEEGEGISAYLHFCPLLPHPVHVGCYVVSLPHVLAIGFVVALTLY